MNRSIPLIVVICFVTGNLFSCSTHRVIFADQNEKLEGDIVVRMEGGEQLTTTELNIYRHPRDLRFRTESGSYEKIPRNNVELIEYGTRVKYANNVAISATTVAGLIFLAGSRGNDDGSLVPLGTYMLAITGIMVVGTVAALGAVVGYLAGEDYVVTLDVPND